jgi:hypothetical protein
LSIFIGKRLATGSISISSSNCDSEAVNLSQEIVSPDPTRQTNEEMVSDSLLFVLYLFEVIGSLFISGKATYRKVEAETKTSNSVSVDILKPMLL